MGWLEFFAICLLLICMDNWIIGYLHVRALKLTLDKKE